jgi:eukaryotic-like serine/threonine-protein kinase
MRMAIKVMLPGAGSDTSMARFERETEILKQLRHPNIVRLLGTGKHKGIRYYAMEYIEGESLDKVLARRGRLSWDEVVDLGKQLCKALQHAHEHGVIHRDLKPSNLMILKDGTLKLTDFGIAKDLDVTQLTAANCTVGTAAYMSPEQCRGERDLTHKSDLYSLGVVFYELLTGRKPFLTENAVEMFMMHVQTVPERPSRFALDIPVWLDNLVCQLLEKKTDHRPLDAKTVADALETIQDKVETQRSAGVDVAKKRVVDRGGEVRKPKDEADKEAARLLLGKKKKKRKVREFYREWWFIGLAAAGLLGGLALAVYFVARPPRPDKLYAEAEKLMAEGTPESYDKARTGPIQQYLSNYGDRKGPQLDQIKAWADFVDVYQSEALLRNYLGKKKRNITLPSKNATEAEAFRAADAEEAGDLKAARAIWENLRKTVTGPWGKLAEQRCKNFADIDAQFRKWDEDVVYIKDTGRDEKRGGPDGLGFAAYRAEKLGDLPLAAGRYEALADAVRTDAEKDAKARQWLLLATGKMREMKDQIKTKSEIKSADVVERELGKVEKVKARIDAEKAGQPPDPPVKQEEVLQARLICLTILALYEDEEALKERVEQARELKKEMNRKLGYVE